jgi:hypothetical protein
MVDDLHCVCFWKFVRVVSWQVHDGLETSGSMASTSRQLLQSTVSKHKLQLVHLLLLF